MIKLNSMVDQRPHVTVVLAMSADGKIADRDRTAARFSSTEDLQQLEQLVAQADAVLFGAGTLRAYGTCLSVRQPELLAQRQVRQQSPQPVQIVCSPTGKLDPQWRFFQQAVPRWLLSTPSGALSWLDSAHPADAFERVWTDVVMPICWLPLLQKFKRDGIERLAVLGGGTLVASLAEQDVIDELHLTVCPLLLGGAIAPTPCDGAGLAIAAALKLHLVEVKQVSNEVFLHYRRCHPEED